MNKAERIAAILLELQAEDRPPPRLLSGGSEEQEHEREVASRSAFTAHDYAQNVDRRYHPRTWRAVRGSVYEKPYRQQFKPPENEPEQEY